MRTVLHCCWPQSDRPGSVPALRAGDKRAAACARVAATVVPRVRSLRNTTPYRRSSNHAMVSICAGSGASSACGAGSARIRLQRPASSSPCVARRRPRAASLRLRSIGNSSARSPLKLSAVTRPAATSSPSAVSACDGNSRAPSTIWSKNEAPCCCRNPAIACAAEESLADSACGGASACHIVAFWRRSRAMGVARTGPAVVLRGGSRRTHSARPDRHRPSSQAGS